MFARVPLIMWALVGDLILNLYGQEAFQGCSGPGSCYFLPGHSQAGREPVAGAWAVKPNEVFGRDRETKAGSSPLQRGSAPSVQRSLVDAYGFVRFLEVWEEVEAKFAAVPRAW